MAENLLAVLLGLLLLRSNGIMLVDVGHFPSYSRARVSSEHLHDVFRLTVINPNVTKILSGEVLDGIRDRADLWFELVMHYRGRTSGPYPRAFAHRPTDEDGKFGCWYARALILRQFRDLRNGG